jgi:23S rRNA (guanosine2251-2'-O)-methyltransferase
MQKGGRTFRPRPKTPPAPEGTAWIWGWHPVEAALANDRREPPLRLLATADRAKQLRSAAAAERLNTLEIVEPGEIGRELPAGAVHQGAALLAPVLEPWSLDEISAPAEGVLLMLDQVTDPQNIGAIFRSAAAFGAQGIILQDRHAPELSGALAKASAGAVERLPHARVVNLSRALERLEENGWRAIGLAGEAEQTLEAVLDARPTVLVLGSEGEGLRRLVAEHCDALARIAMPGGFESLNVSAAAAVALYAATRAGG